MKNNKDEFNEQMEWLIKNCDKFINFRELTNSFNKHFNCNISYRAIKSRMYNRGFRKPLEKYTNEQNEWLINNIDKYSRKELQLQFNTAFNCNKTEDALKKHCNNNLHVYFKTNNERYKINLQKQQKNKDVGSIRHTKKGTYIKATNDVNERKWVLLTRYVNGLTNEDKDKVVVVIDENKPITKENTMVLDKATMGIICKKNHFKLPPQLKRLAYLSATHQIEINKFKLKNNNSTMQ